ncbi:adenine phosphoribosyltransferase [Quadrisphaera granulorum]|uniref:Adenine phosphoribosyltransferase n=1 Tax=Quadrisphaera granulorum TaxID=317664 RepID=A0A316A8L5_9ACTN|nr:adenine phosphoribosyltransferase [Quadrisphaera granulorum]PWJ53538.1 adenine phosphoribosyltransferase [Quadrisphaera granulorum]SZE96880.1 adenine phosphoribosyltransferase [Quadrisphaera granulorum]
MSSSEHRATHRAHHRATTDDDAAGLLSLLRAVPDHPAPGITFWDITPLLGDAGALARATEALAVAAQALPGGRVDLVAGVEARGFVLGAPLALALGAGFVPLRKAGKLPWRTVRQDYSLEYGKASIEAHEDAVPAGARVLVIDDVLATGGTAAAACALVNRLGGELAGVVFLLELLSLQGRAALAPALAGAPVTSVLQTP